MSSTEKYVQDLFLNVKTNHPITVVYTDDPNETLALTRSSIPALRAATDRVYYWSSRKGWQNVTDTKKSFAQHIANPVPVKITKEELKKTPLSFAFGSPEEVEAKYPVFIMSLFSVQFKKDVMTLMQELRDFDYMVRNNVNGTYRLIVVANKSFEIPDDYENIFGVVHHQLPTRDELRSMYQENFLKDYIGGLLAKIYDGDFSAVQNNFEALEDYVVNTLSGLTTRQSKLILMKATSKNHTRQGDVITAIDFDGWKTFIYEEKFREISKSGAIKLMKPVPIDEVGGLHLLTDWVRQRKKAFSPEARAAGVKRPKGMALIGPSGTGKSYVAEATAGILEWPCVGLNLSSIFNKFVGESENNMELIKHQIEAMAPAVVYIDEIDKVFSSEAGGSSGGDSGVTSRVLGKLLSWIQDTKEDLFFVVTANRAHKIPAELLRKGRFDEIWSVTFPTPSERKEILNIHLKKRGYSLKNINKAVEQSQGFSSAELEHVVNEAVVQAFVNETALSEKHLLEQIEETNPISEAFAEDIGRMAEWAKQHARPSSVAEKIDNSQLESAGI